MGIFDDATREVANRIDTSGSDDAGAADAASMARATDAREVTATVEGKSVSIKDPETVKTDEEGTWLTGTQSYGRPRGSEAIEAREIVQTSAMQAIGNGIVDQLLGGELTFESESDTVSSTEAAVRDLIRDVLTGPHLGSKDLDDLITGAVFDMLGPAQAYWQLHPSENDEFPVVALSNLDALTIRHNVDRHGMWGDPPFYQATGAFSGDGVGTLGKISPTPLQHDQLVVMHYPRGERPYRYYPMSPSLQVKEWLEILANSTTHHNRFYADNEIPPGLIQVMGAQNVSDIKEKIEAASGDPRDVPVIGGDGGAQWLELGGTAVNLNIIEEQRWFFNMCLGALGLGKHELGFTEDANRSNGEIEATRIYKRIAGPFSKQFERAFQHIANQFDVYQALEQPFDIRLRFTDPREEQAREQRLREMWQAGGLTYRQYVRRRGDDDLAAEDMTVELNGNTIDYGGYPKHVLDALLRDARSDPDADADMGDDDSGDADPLT
jgi:hypothetical protein